MNLFVSIIIIFLALLFIASCYLIRMVIKPIRSTNEKSISYVKRRNLWGNFDSYQKEELNVTSFDGYLLHGFLLRNNNNKKYVIVTHGYTDTRYGSVKYANIYYKLGYNVYIYDLRHHGENLSCHCSMSYYENRDIKAIAGTLRERYGDDIEIGLHGESLGCASSISVLGSEQRFTFVVADCGFSRLGELLEYQGKRRMHLPKIIIKIAGFANVLLNHYNFYSINPIDALKKNRVPVLFIHGSDDDYIPPWMSEQMYEACIAPKKLVLFPNAKHAQSIASDPVFYEQVVSDFLKTIS